MTRSWKAEKRFIVGISTFLMIFAMAGSSPSGKQALAQETDSVSDPSIVATVEKDGQRTEYKKVDEAWKALSGKKGSVMKLYRDWNTGSAIAVGNGYSGVTLDLNGHTIRRKTNGKTRDGEVLSINSGASITITNGTITGGNSKNGAGGINVGGGKLIMNGGTISGNATTDDGGGLLLRAGSAELTGVSFRDNKAGDNGGGIYFKQGSALTVRSCSFEKNSAGKNGGAIAVKEEYAKLFDVIMLNNKADSDGGGLWVNANRTYLSGGTIKYNMADYGGGVYVDSAFDLNIQGKLVIQNNQTTSRERSNLCLQDGWFSSAKIYSGGLMPGSKVGLNKTKSLSSKGYTAVVNTSWFQEKLYFTADRGKLYQPKGSINKVIYMATAMGELNLAPFFVIALELIAAAAIIVIAVRKRKRRIQIANGEEDGL